MVRVQSVDGAPVLNGRIQVGDQVAVGVRDGNSGGIRMGRVIRIMTNDQFAWNYKTRSYDIPIYSVQVQLVASSEYVKPEVLAAAKPRWYGTDNMVRIN